MTFYERYAQICADKGLKPRGQKAADMFGITKATICSWEKNNTTPKGETVAIMADALGFSSDYLLGRTDDPTDYAKGKNDSNTAPKLCSTDQSLPQPEILKMFNQLDFEDQLKVEGIIQGLLLSDKYKKKQNYA